MIYESMETVVPFASNSLGAFSPKVDLRSRPPIYYTIYRSINVDITHSSKRKAEPIFYTDSPYTAVAASLDYIVQQLCSNLLTSEPFQCSYESQNRCTLLIVPVE